MPRYVEKGSTKVTGDTANKEDDGKQVEAATEQPQKKQSNKPKEERPLPAKPKYKEKVSTGETPADNPEKGEQETKEPVEKKEPTKRPQNKQQKRVEKQRRPENQGYKGYNKSSRRYKKSRYDWNYRNITLETVVPDVPKNVLPKPDGVALDKKIDEIEAKIKELKNDLKNKRINRDNEIKAAQSKKQTYRTMSSVLSAKLRQIWPAFNKAKDHVNSLFDVVNDLTDKLKELRNKKTSLRQGRKMQYKSELELKRRKQELESILITKQLNKIQRKKVQEQIYECDRYIADAKNDVELQAQHDKINDLIAIEQQQLNKVRDELNAAKKEKQALRAQIKQHESQHNNDESQVKKVRSRNEIQDEYEDQKEAIYNQIDKLNEEIDQLELKFKYDREEYEEQEELLEYIKFVTEQKKYLKQRQEQRERKEKQRKAEQERKKKEWEKELKQRQRKKEEYEAKKKEREERQKKYEEQRQQRLNSLPYDEQKKLCDFLKDYCRRLQPKTEKTAANSNSNEPIVLKGSEWDKETKKGAKLIVNKKEQDQLNQLNIGKPDKKPKVEKKVEQQENKIDHNINVVRMFDRLHVLPPEKVSNIQETIQAIDKMFEYYKNPSEEDIKKHRDRIAAEIEEEKERRRYRQDRRDDRRDERDDRRDDRRDDKRDDRRDDRKEEKKEQRKKANPILLDSDFPDL